MTPVLRACDGAIPFRRPFGGTWTFQLTPAASGTRVTLTENGEVHNPSFRFLSRLVFGHTSTIESCLRALARKHG